MKMKKLADIIREAVDRSGKGDLIYRRSAYFVLDNGIFGHDARQNADGECCIHEEDVPDVGARLDVFMSHLDETDEEKVSYLGQVLGKSFPDTWANLSQFFKEEQDVRPLPILDYLAARLEKEVRQMDDQELEAFTGEMFSETTVSATKGVALFAAWMKLRKGGTSYRVDILITGRGTKKTMAAYGLEALAEMYYYFFNQEYICKMGSCQKYAGDGTPIAQPTMYQAACDNREYANAVLYICLHLICAVRDTDLMEIPRPDLPYDARQTLEKIREGTLGDQEAAHASHSLMNLFSYSWEKPDKTASHTGIPDIVLQIPQSLEGHFGMLLLICTAHILIRGEPETTPVVRPVTGYRKLKGLFEEEIYTLFRDQGCSPLAFTKSHLQALSAVAAGSGYSTNTSAALLRISIAGWARSHKKGVRDFSVATLAYLEDCALGVLTPDMVARELFERGALSCITSEFLSILTNKRYASLDFEQQTSLFKELGLSAMEIERAMELFAREKMEARKTLENILSQPDGNARKKEATLALHRIASGFAPGKDRGAHCFLQALGKACIHPGYDGCLACPYKVDTRTTLYHAVGELKRLSRLSSVSATEGSRKKYDLIAKKYLIPSIVSIVDAAANVYGDRAKEVLESIIQDAMKERGGEEQGPVGGKE